MGKEFTSIGPHLNASRAEPARTRRELDEAVIKAQREESGTDAFRVRIGQDEVVKVSRKWLPKVLLAVVALGGGGIAARDGVSLPGRGDSARIEALEAEVGGIKSSITRLDRRFLVQTLNQNHQWLWEARRADVRDREREQRLQQEIDALSRELEGDDRRAER